MPWHDAVAWAAARGAKLAERAWIEPFAAMLGHGATVLDIGCGSGWPIAACLAGWGHRVADVDSPPEMIALFRANLPGEAAEVADMRSLSLGSRFGGLVAWDSLFHLAPDEQRLMFPVFRDHALPDAPLLFTSGELITTQALADPSQAAVVSVRNGQPAVTDGPFLESRECLGGFYLAAGRPAARGQGALPASGYSPSRGRTSGRRDRLGPGQSRSRRRALASSQPASRSR